MTDRKLTLRIKSVPAPDNVHGAGTRKGDAYLLLINENDTEQRQLLALLHEILHIWHNDYDHGPGTDLTELERVRHEELKTLLQLL